MDKVIEEEDFKGLDEEIDDAVDRLFIDNKRGSGKSLSVGSPALKTPLKSVTEEPPIKSPSSQPSIEPLPLEPMEPSMQSPISEPFSKPSIAEPSMKPSFLEPSYEFELEKNLSLERNLGLETTPHPPSPPLQFSKSIDNMEAQLLSLEWEITEEKLRKTREEILALRELLKQKPDLASILSDMEKVLSHMIENEENIRPSWIKILLDSKETIKLLTRAETEGEINIYKQLAYLGIEARFSSLEGLKEPKAVQPSRGKGEAIEKAEHPILGEKKMEDVSNKMNLFMANVEEMFRTMKQQISRLEETTRKPAAPPVEFKPKTLNVTVFRVDKKLFGVETEKVFKLFKVPNTLQKKYSNQDKIQFKDFELKMINLKKTLAIPGGEPKGETRILAVKDNGEYKGLLVDQVVKKVSAPSEKEGKAGEYFSGIIHSTYQEQSVEIPILDLKKF
jgi:chemotaxis signal transduction protein